MMWKDCYKDNYYLGLFLIRNVYNIYTSAFASVQTHTFILFFY